MLLPISYGQKKEMFGGSLQTGQDSDSRRMIGDGGWMQGATLASLFSGVAWWEVCQLGAKAESVECQVGLCSGRVREGPPIEELSSSASHPRGFIGSEKLKVLQEHMQKTS